ncbi:MAG: L-sorbosone dehydrogenase, partial [Planctomycetota bacterium]
IFDADMEWDIGTPWYRPTRICHVVGGSDYGWRSGNGKWRDYYVDSLPSTVDVGPGSPTGIVFGRGAKFPPRYQQALFAADWSYGNIFAVHLTPEGASYRGEVEAFASAQPLAVTDMVVNPRDGALYFAVGGRKTASALYRIVWDGVSGSRSTTIAREASTESEPGSASQDRQRESRGAVEARSLRRKLEMLHGRRGSDNALDVVWNHLDHADRYVRHAARVALEHQSTSRWMRRALEESNPVTRIAALAGLARVGDGVDPVAWCEALIGIEADGLSRAGQLDLLRTAALGVMRLGPLATEQRRGLLAQFDPLVPDSTPCRRRETRDRIARVGRVAAP